MNMWNYMNKKIQKYKIWRRRPDVAVLKFFYCFQKNKSLRYINKILYKYSKDFYLQQSFFLLKKCYFRYKFRNWKILWLENLVNLYIYIYINVLYQILKQLCNFQIIFLFERISPFLFGSNYMLNQN